MDAVPRLRLTPSEFEDLHELSLRRHWSWPGPVFTVNARREIWPFVTHGFTHAEDRVYIQGVSRLIDTVAEHALIVRGEGGRFFINKTGAFYRNGHRLQIVEFEFCRQ